MLSGVKQENKQTGRQTSEDNFGGKLVLLLIIHLRGYKGIAVYSVLAVQYDLCTHVYVCTIV